MSEVENSRLDEQKAIDQELAVVGETVTKEDEETAEDIIEQMTLEESQEPIIEPEEQPQEEPEPVPEDHKLEPEPEVPATEPEVPAPEPEVPICEPENPEPSPEPVDPLSIENENKKELELMNDISTLQTDLKEAATKVNSLQQQLHAMEKYKQVADSFMSISEGASDPAVWYRAGGHFLASLFDID